MLRINRVKDRIRAGETVYGPFLKCSAPQLVEVMGNAGFDFVLIDMEHGPHTTETVEGLIRAATVANFDAIIRVPENRENAILKALDGGAHGILVPHVSGPEEARQVVAAAKFAPEGERGMDIYARSSGFGEIPKGDYLRQANETTLVAIQIEGAEGVRNLGDILDVSGIDVIFVGPYDLSQSLGIPGQIDHPELVAKVKEIVGLARGAGKAVGIYVDTPEAARRWRALGVRFIAISVDVAIFDQACRRMVADLKEGPAIKH
ncbi:MAG TPA: HpcH/HpaI aldolase/citrate lyase family protein [Firmicutes bacterium]|nr:HpcH/HpaI aldolase/citrate lyase family protein [Bacillota bacterium]